MRRIDLELLDEPLCWAKQRSTWRASWLIWRDNVGSACARYLLPLLVDRLVAVQRGDEVHRRVALFEQCHERVRAERMTVVDVEMSDQLTLDSALRTLLRENWFEPESACDPVGALGRA